VSAQSSQHNTRRVQNREVGWLHATIRKLHLGNNKIKTVPGELYVRLLITAGYGVAETDPSPPLLRSFLNPAVDLDLGNNPLGVTQCLPRGLQ
jgi:hypothetical protein